MIFTTASQGSFLFVPHSELLVTEGAITFSSTWMRRSPHRGRIDPALLEQVEDALSQVRTAFPITAFPLASTLLYAEIQEYAFDGTIHDGAVALTFFVATSIASVSPRWPSM